MTTATETTVYNKENPFIATLKENRLLNKPGSSKDTRHYVVDVSGSGIEYSCGDSLGIYPCNRDSDVEDLIRVLGASGEEKVVLPRTEQEITLREALSRYLSLAAPTPKFLQFLADKVTAGPEKDRLDSLLDPKHKEEQKGFLADREFIDLLEEFPAAEVTPQELVDNMRKLVPRLYSIASSPKAYPEEIHLTVATVEYTTNGRPRVGVCSTFLRDRVSVGERAVPVFVTQSHFGLPEDDSADVIMVGPGTGIAPFRAFLQERSQTGASGRNWLFFGDQHAATDFLYEEEWEPYLENGCLTRLDTAWSRDQEQKVYVQDKMRENAAEIWAWLQQGAFFYVCGDAKRMAKDVDAALHDIARNQGGMNEDEAKSWVKLLKKEKRYQRDVY